MHEAGSMSKAGRLRAASSAAAPFTLANLGSAPSLPDGKPPPANQPDLQYARAGSAILPGRLVRRSASAASARAPTKQQQLHEYLLRSMPAPAPNAWPRTAAALDGAGQGAAQHAARRSSAGYRRKERQARPARGTRGNAAPGLSAVWHIQDEQRGRRVASARTARQAGSAALPGCVRNPVLQIPSMVAMGCSWSPRVTPCSSETAGHWLHCVQDHSAQLAVAERLAGLRRSMLAECNVHRLSDRLAGIAAPHPPHRPRDSGALRSHGLTCATFGVPSDQSDAEQIANVRSSGMPAVGSRRQRNVRLSSGRRETWSMQPARTSEAGRRRTWDSYDAQARGHAQMRALELRKLVGEFQLE
jgi:hypothetical protein